MNETTRVTGDLKFMENAGGNIGGGSKKSGGQNHLFLKVPPVVTTLVLSMPKYVVLHSFVNLHLLFTNRHSAFDLVQHFKQAVEKLLNFYNS